MICGIVIECSLTPAHILRRIWSRRYPIINFQVRQHTDEEIAFHQWLEGKRLRYSVSKYRAHTRMETLKMMYLVDICVVAYDHNCFELTGIVEVIKTFQKPTILMSSDAYDIKKWRYK